MKVWMMSNIPKKSLNNALSKSICQNYSKTLLVPCQNRFDDFFYFFFRIFDANEKEKVDINELLAIKENNATLKEMQHSKWATSNNLFDYNAFINDFYALLEDYKSYKSRFQETTQELSHEQKSANLEVLSSIKGSFFYNGENVISHQYSMVMTRPSKVKISLQVSKPMDMDIFVFHIKQEKSDISYKFICKSEVTVGTKKEVVWEGSLDKGVYVLIPSTTGCLFRKRQNQPTSDIHLTCMENGETQLGHEYHQAIIEIFHQLDLDESGSLSKAEFNLYNWRTSGMEMKVSKTFFLPARNPLLWS